MAYADFTFYGSSYFGDTLTEETAPKWLERASDELDAITFGRLTFAFPTVEAHAAKVRRLFVPLPKPSTGSTSSGGHLPRRKRRTEAITGLSRLSRPDGNPFPIRRAARTAPFMLPPRQAQRHKQF